MRQVRVYDANEKVGKWHGIRFSLVVHPLCSFDFRDETQEHHPCHPNSSPAPNHLLGHTDLGATDFRGAVGRRVAHSVLVVCRERKLQWTPKIRTVQLQWKGLSQTDPLSTCQIAAVSKKCQYSGLVVDLFTRSLACTFHTMWRCHVLTCHTFRRPSSTQLRPRRKSLGSIYQLRTKPPITKNNEE